jgi:hypothetical protein
MSTMDDIQQIALMLADCVLLYGLISFVIGNVVTWSIGKGEKMRKKSFLFVKWRT